jgi:hypothetical protein
MTDKKDDDYFVVKGVKFTKHPKPSLKPKKEHPLKNIDNGQEALWRAKY